jgi:hypothetical protein
VTELRGDQVPRISCWPEYETSRGAEAIELCRAAGLVLDEHQQFVVERMLGLRSDGTFACFEVGVVEPRQNGKGGIIEARELAGVELLREELLIHSAHEYATALEAFYRMLALLETADVKIRKVRNAHGEQGIDFANGSRLRYRTRTRGGGRGFSCDFLGLDEGMFLPEFAHGALLPTMSARPNPQVLYTGSAVDQESHDNGVVLARVRERGISGEDKRLGYCEWSLEYDNPEKVPDEIAGDVAAWARANPALGLRIRPEHIASEYRSMTPRTFAVERLGVGDWPQTGRFGTFVIDPELWASLADKRSRALAPVVFAFDVNPLRSRSSIAVVGLREDELYHVELIEHEIGTGWVSKRLAELDERHAPAAILCDSVGPVASLVSEVEALGVEVTTIQREEMAQACGFFFDAVERQEVRHTEQSELTNAIKGAAKRPLGDAWAWSRKNSQVDISPLVAATIALWHVGQKLTSVYDDRGMVAV